MPSQVDIANRALSRLGEARILAMTDALKAARAATSAWDIVRDEVLRMLPWNCATTRAELPVLASTPAYEFDYEYQKPADCLRVLELWESDLPWRVEGEKILTDEGPPLRVRYIKRVTDPNSWDPLLISAFASRLEAELAIELAQDTSKWQKAWSQYEKILELANRTDAQEGSGAEFLEDSWVRERL